MVVGLEILWMAQHHQPTPANLNQTIFVFFGFFIQFPSIIFCSILVETGFFVGSLNVLTLLYYPKQLEQEPRRA
jgi:hypothetical protein